MTTTMKISLPEELKAAAETLAKEGHYASMSSYVQHLFRRELERKRNKQKLRQMLIEALDAEPVEMTLGELKAELLTSAEQ